MFYSFLIVLPKSRFSLAQHLYRYFSNPRLTQVSTRGGLRPQCCKKCYITLGFGVNKNSIVAQKNFRKFWKALKRQIMCQKNSETHFLCVFYIKNAISEKKISKFSFLRDWLPCNLISHKNLQFHRGGGFFRPTLKKLTQLGRGIEKIPLLVHIFHFLGFYGF